MKEFLQKIAGALAKTEKTLIIILLPIMCIIILLNTLARITGLFTAQLIWAEEFARYLMIWMAFIGAALVMQEDGHYKMTAVEMCIRDRRNPCRFIYLYYSADFQFSRNRRPCRAVDYGGYGLL